MRFGAHVFGYTDAESWARKHVEHGYGATYFPLSYRDAPEKIDAYVDAARRHNLVIAEIGIWNNQLDRDPVKREQYFHDAVEQFKLADRIGARCCVNIAGSLADTWDGPHPDNLTDENFNVIVRNIQAIIDAAKPKNCYYTLEPMPWMFPRNVEDMWRLIKAVDRDAFAVHADMCNMVNSFDLVYHTGDLVRSFFSEFGKLIRAVHAKDTVLGKHLTLHISEAIPGDGVFDYDALLTECNKLDPDLPVMAEHLETEEQYLRATSHFQKKAAELGIQPLFGC